MSFEELDLDHLTSKGEEVYGKKPNEEKIKEIIEANKKAEADFMKKISEKRTAKPIKLYEVDDLGWKLEDEPESKEELKKAS